MKTAHACPGCGNLIADQDIDAGEMVGLSQPALCASCAENSTSGGGTNEPEYPEAGADGMTFAPIEYPSFICPDCRCGLLNDTANFTPGIVEMGFSCPACKHQWAYNTETKTTRCIMRSNIPQTGE
jgi:hypothetical protein